MLTDRRLGRHFAKRLGLEPPTIDALEEPLYRSLKPFYHRTPQHVECISKRAGASWVNYGDGFISLDTSGLRILQWKESADGVWKSETLVYRNERIDCIKALGEDIIEVSQSGSQVRFLKKQDSGCYSENILLNLNRALVDSIVLGRDSFAVVLCSGPTHVFTKSCEHSASLKHPERQRGTRHGLHLLRVDMCPLDQGFLYVLGSRLCFAYFNEDGVWNEETINNTGSNHPKMYPYRNGVLLRTVLDTSYLRRRDDGEWEQTPLNLRESIGGLVYPIVEDIFSFGEHFILIVQGHEAYIGKVEEQGQRSLKRVFENELAPLVEGLILQVIPYKSGCLIVGGDNENRVWIVYLSYNNTSKEWSASYQKFKTAGLSEEKLYRVRDHFFFHQTSVVAGLQTLSIMDRWTVETHWSKASNTIFKF